MLKFYFIIAVLMFGIDSKSDVLNACGLNGEISDRIEDCNLSDGKFSLVTRLENGEQIWLDQVSYKTWAIVQDLACESLENKFPGFDWRAPKLREVQNLKKRLSASQLASEQNYTCVGTEKEPADEWGANGMSHF